jgi:hypothetical protein
MILKPLAAISRRPLGIAEEERFGHYGANDLANRIRECTNFTNEVCEAALAQVIENKAEAAYRRGGA